MEKGKLVAKIVMGIAGAIVLSSAVAGFYECRPNKSLGLIGQENSPVYEKRTCNYYLPDSDCIDFCVLDKL